MCARARLCSGRAAGGPATRLQADDGSTCEVPRAGTGAGAAARGLRAGSFGEPREPLGRGLASRARRAEERRRLSKRTRLGSCQRRAAEARAGIKARAPRRASARRARAARRARGCFANRLPRGRGRPAAGRRGQGLRTDRLWPPGRSRIVAAACSRWVERVALPSSGAQVCVPWPPARRLANEGPGAHRPSKAVARARAPGRGGGRGCV